MPESKPGDVLPAAIAACAEQVKLIASPQSGQSAEVAAIYAAAAKDLAVAYATLRGTMK